MKKRLLMILFLLFVFVYVKPVFASTELYVCTENGCDYETLDEALNAAQSPESTGEGYNIHVSGEHEITGTYEFSVPVYIVSNDGDDIIIQGNNSIISSTQIFSFSSGRDLTVKNLTVQYIGNFTDVDGSVHNSFLVMAMNRADLSHVIVTASGHYNLSNGNIFPEGLVLEVPKVNLTSVRVENFYVGVASQANELSIDGCSLKDNYYSVWGDTYDVFSSNSDNEIALKNTELSRAVIFATTVSVSGITLPIHYVNDNYLDDFDSDDDAYHDPALYVWTLDDMTVSNDLLIDFDFKRQKGIDDFLALFRLNSIMDSENFVLTSSDPTIAKVDGMKVTFLKPGTVTVTATSTATNETFTALLRINDPTPTNPKTGRHIIMILLGCLLLGGITFVSIKKRNEKSN